ncbi:hypothetical protein AALB_1423 [Agarivorans albus MKT 106]|uniref:Uncharacterized protein n=1 Tax=Agarivorans albus MKT 106 TaxID=1331007 RepID=R9PJD7_AGAAL|nr:hypothetical protein AALB_1423 [Agarivorans albus MKT 106]
MLGAFLIGKVTRSSFCHLVFVCFGCDAAAVVAAFNAI